MDAFKETVLMTQNVAREASKQGIEMGRRESAEKIRILREALSLVLVGLANGNVKAKPIISFSKTSESADMQSLQEIIEAALMASA